MIDTQQAADIINRSLISNYDIRTANSSQAVTHASLNEVVKAIKYQQQLQQEKTQDELINDRCCRIIL